MGNLFTELKRRKVFRVAAVYAVVAWLVVQIADVVLSTFEVSQQINQLLIILLLLGFPLALVLAWAYEVTPDGQMVRPGDSDEIPVSEPASSTNSIVIPLMVIAVGFLFFDRYVLNGSPESPDLPIAPDAEAIRSSLVLGYFPVEDPGRTDVTITPDGRQIAFVARTDEGRSL